MLCILSVNHGNHSKVTKEKLKDIKKLLVGKSSFVLDVDLKKKIFLGFSDLCHAILYCSF